MDEQDSSPFDSVQSGEVPQQRGSDFLQSRVGGEGADAGWPVEKRQQLLQAYRQLMQAQVTAGAGGGGTGV